MGGCSSLVQKLCEQPGLELWVHRTDVTPWWGPGLHVFLDFRVVCVACIIKLWTAVHKPFFIFAQFSDWNAKDGN